MAPCIHVGDPDETPDSWLASGPDLPIPVIWGVNQQEDSLSSPSFLMSPLYNSVIQVNKNPLKIKKVSSTRAGIFVLYSDFVLGTGQGSDKELGK